MSPAGVPVEALRRVAARFPERRAALPACWGWALGVAQPELSSPSAERVETAPVAMERRHDWCRSAELAQDEPERPLADSEPARSDWSAA